MKEKSNANGYKESETVLLSHWDKKQNKWVQTIYPKISGRLRLAHEENKELSISTEILRNDENVAVVGAKTVTGKGTFNGIGMASTERDKNIAPAILELAETRAIARSLRFAGYGIDYCSAEEVSHLEQENHSSPSVKNGHEEPQRPIVHHPPANDPSTDDKGNGGNGGSTKGNNGNGRLSQKQHSFLLHLADERGVSRKDLDEMSKERFACVVSYLSKSDASSLIQEMTAH